MLNGMTRSIIAGLLALAALALPAGALAAPQAALVFSHVTTVMHGTETEERGGLYLARGEDVSQLTKDPADSEPAFSPDGSTVAFVRGGNVFTMRPDGTAERQLTSGPEIDSRPQFTVDGRSLVFERSAGAGAPRDLYVVGARGGNQRALTSSPDDEHEVALSPNGKTLAFVRSMQETGGGTSDAIFSIRLNGSGLARLTHGNEDSFAPHYFAGGIVFDRGESSAGPSGYSDIYSMRADGRKPRKLVGGASSVYLRDVSPDGQTMLFSRYESLCVKKISGGAPHKVGPLPEGVKVQALYSADGKTVAVRVEGGGEVTATEQRLYLLDPGRGLELGELAGADGEAELPAQIGALFAWQPKTAGAY
ncbi:MAG: TolB family protein [Solirubrobacterales bacterium]